jgi:hypothetical protein
MVLLSLPLFKKTGSESFNLVYIKKLWPSPWRFSSRNAPDWHPRTGFFTRTKPQSTPLQISNGGEGIKTVHHTNFFPDIASAKFFLFWGG